MMTFPVGSSRRWPPEGRCRTTETNALLAKYPREVVAEKEQLFE
jgi:hypothetical protein